MNVSTKCFLIITLILSSCSGAPDSPLLEEGTAISNEENNNINIEGKWDHVYFGFVSKNNSQVVFDDLSFLINDCWIISSDTIKVFEYPHYFLTSFPYQISGDSLFYDFWSDGIGNDNGEFVHFNEDTLILIQDAPDAVWISKFIPIIIDDEELTKLEIQEVNWNFYEFKWKWHDALLRSDNDFERFTLDSDLDFQLPWFLDLTKTNSVNFSTHGKKLEYNDDGVIYNLLFNDKQTFNKDEVINKMSLLFVSPEGSEYELTYEFE